MTTLPDGRVVICTLALPLPAQVVGDVAMALSGGLGRLGWSDMVLLTDGTNRIVARPPAPEVDE